MGNGGTGEATPLQTISNDPRGGAAWAQPPRRAEAGSAPARMEAAVASARGARCRGERAGDAAPVPLEDPAAGPEAAQTPAPAARALTREPPRSSRTAETSIAARPVIPRS